MMQCLIIRNLTSMQNVVLCLIIQRSPFYNRYGSVEIPYCSITLRILTLRNIGYLVTNMKEQGDSEYKRLIDILFMEVKRVFRLYSGKFSKRTYAQHQLAVVTLLMKYERKTHRDIDDLLKELQLYFGLGRPTPHFTTLEKFFMRIQTYIWDFLLARTHELIMHHDIMKRDRKM